MAERSGTGVVQLRLDWLFERVRELDGCQLTPQTPVIPFHWTKAPGSASRGEMSHGLATSTQFVVRPPSVGATMEIAKIDQDQPNGIT